MLNAPPKLVQKRFRRTLTLEVRENELYCTNDTGSGTYNWHLPLAHIGEHYAETWSRGRGRWLLVCVMLLVGGFLAPLGGIGLFVNESGRSTPLIVLAVGIALVIPAVLIAIVSWRHPLRLIHFFNRYNGDCFLSIQADRPSPEAVMAFLDPILRDAKRIADENEEQALMSAEKLNAAAELRRFHDLWKKGVLTEEEFTSRKDVILREVERSAV